MDSPEKYEYCSLHAPVVCGSCGGENDVINYCLQCLANICEECKSTHCKQRLTQHHIILHRTHPEVVKARRAKKIYCPEHTGKEYVTYCMRCSRPCCATCITETHDGHKFTDLENTIAKTQSDVEELVQNIENDLIPLDQNVISTLDEEISSYKRSMEQVKQSAKDRIRLLKEQLDKAEKSFLVDVDEHGKKAVNIMEIQKMEAENNLEKAKSLVAKGKIAPVDASLLSIKQELSKAITLRPSLITCQGNMSFHTSTFHFPSAFAVIGSIDDGAKKIVYDASSHYDILQKELYDNNTDVRVLMTIQNEQGSSVLHSNKDEVWVCDEKSIDIYNHNFAKIKTIKLDFTCSDIAVYGSQDVIATDNERIVRMSNSGSITEVCRTAPLTPWGICVNNKRDIVVGGEIEGLGLGPWKLLVYSSDGSSVLQEIEEDQSGEQLFTGWITRVRQTVNGEYVVANGKDVLCLSQEWKLNWKYKFGPKFAVFALYCDMKNRILVGDRDKNEIVMLNKDGHLIRSLLTKENGICEPLSIAVDSKGRLWIGQENNILISSYMK